MQESFANVWGRWDAVKDHPDPRAYLYRTAFNLLRNRRRRARLAATHFLTSGSTTDAFEAIDDRDMLGQALRSLTARQRAAVVLTDLMDLSSAEASDLLGVKPSTVRVLAARARSVLKAEMERADG